jgi:hypothetical protein
MNIMSIRIRLKPILYFCFGLQLICTFGCSKEENSGAPYLLYPIHGVATVTDYYSNASAPVAFANMPVYIRIAGGRQDTSNYFFSTLTDRNGQFGFYINDTSTKYEIFTTTKIKSSSSFAPLYSGIVTTNIPYDSTDLYQLSVSIDDKLQNGINFTVQDINGQRLSGVTVLLYNSMIVDTADKTFSGNGALYKFNTDSLGKGYTSNLPKGLVYVNAVLNINDKKNLSVISDSVSISAEGSSLKTLVLK